MQKVLRNLEEFEEEAAAFAQALRPSATGAALVTLSGELGVGKTVFTKIVAWTLGVTELVTSPTFVLEKVYELPTSALFKKLIHIDAYRLEDGAELAPLKFDELMRDTHNLILLEWPEKVADALPKATYAISITIHKSGSRLIIYG